MSLQLKKIREKINNIDEKILNLLIDRIALAQQALSEKTKQPENQQSIFDPLREHRMLDELMQKNTGSLSNKGLKDIFSTIIKVSRDNQYALTQNTHPFTISIQGAKGCFCEQALGKYCQEKGMNNYQINYDISSRNVLMAIKKNPAHYGLVALNNARGGLVEETIAALAQHKYLIIDSIIFLVQQSLIIHPNNKNLVVKDIYSHSQALRQCADFLKKHYHQAIQHNYSDTALAATDLQQGKLPENSAVIAHKSCAVNTDLIVLKENIHDLTKNETIFLLIKGQ